MTNSLAPGQRYESEYPTTLYFDHQIGEGECYTKKELDHGSYAFETKDYKYLELNYKENLTVNSY